jgi:hypothetical protein
VGWLLGERYPDVVDCKTPKGFHPSLKTMFSLQTSSPGFDRVTPLRDTNRM